MTFIGFSIHLYKMSDRVLPWIDIRKHKNERPWGCKSEKFSKL